MVWLLLPLGGVLAYLLLSAPSPAASWGQTPELGPSVPKGQPSPARADAYLSRLGNAINAYKAAKFIGQEATARSVLVSTIDVVSGMAEADGLSGKISQTDLGKIRDRISKLKQEAGI